MVQKSSNVSTPEPSSILLMMSWTSTSVGLTPARLYRYDSKSYFVESCQHIISDAPIYLPHCWQQRPIRYLAIAIPVKIVESFPERFSVRFIQMTFLAADSKNASSASQYLHSLSGKRFSFEAKFSTKLNSFFCPLSAKTRYLEITITTMKASWSSR